MRLKKNLLILICLIFFVHSFSQQKLPLLSSDSLTINIKIDDKPVGYWHVESDTKPGTDTDVFAMDRSFSDQKIAYISNRDSIAFNVKPGEKHNFIIQIDKRLFFVQVTTIALPIILRGKVFAIVVIFLFAIALIPFIKRKPIETKTWLLSGIISPLLFWIATIVGGFLHGDYNHLHNVVSELGAIGTKSEIFMSVSEILVGILSIFSVVGFFKACREMTMNLIPALTILSLSISMFWAAIFPMRHVLHGALGPIPLILILGALLSVFLWRKKEFLSIRIISGIASALMLLILLRTIPALRNSYEGMIQRFFYLGWTIWSVSLSLFFMNKDVKIN